MPEKEMQKTWKLNKNEANILSETCRRSTKYNCPKAAEWPIGVWGIPGVLARGYTGDVVTLLRC